MALELASGVLTRITASIPWDISSEAASHDGRWLAAQVNNDGRDELRLFDAQTLKPLAAPSLPAGGIGNNMSFHPRVHRLAYALNSSKGPSQLYVSADPRRALPANGR